MSYRNLNDRYACTPVRVSINLVSQTRLVRAVYSSSGSQSGDEQLLTTLTSDARPLGYRPARHLSNYFIYSTQRAHPQLYKVHQKTDAFDFFPNVQECFADNGWSGFGFARFLLDVYSLAYKILLARLLQSVCICGVCFRRFVAYQRSFS